MACDLSKTCKIGWSSTLKPLSDTTRKLQTFFIESYFLFVHYFWHGNTYYKQIKGITMGAKFAPSVANIFMAAWEEKYLSSYSQRIMYKQYKDYVLIVWKGEISTLDFLTKLNQCPEYYSFVGIKRLHFLDLTISAINRSFKTKTFF